MVEDNLMAIISLQNQLPTLTGAQRAYVVDQIDNLLKEQYNSSYPFELPSNMMQIVISPNSSLQQFIMYLEADQTLAKNDFQNFSQPQQPRTTQQLQCIENQQLFDVKFFSFKDKAISQGEIWEAYDKIMEQIDDSNQQYAKEDQINSKIIVKFLSAQANKMFNHTKREAVRLPLFLQQIGLDFQLTEHDLLGFRNLCYGCFQEFKHLILRFLEQFPLKECRLCVDDVVDFETTHLGVTANVIIILRLAIFMINLENICERILANSRKDEATAGAPKAGDGEKPEN